MQLTKLLLNLKFYKCSLKQFVACVFITYVNSLIRQMLRQINNKSFRNQSINLYLQFFRHKIVYVLTILAVHGRNIEEIYRNPPFVVLTHHPWPPPHIMSQKILLYILSFFIPYFTIYHIFIFASDHFQIVLF